MPFEASDFYVGMIAYYTVNELSRDRRIRTTNRTRDSKPRPFICYAEADGEAYWTCLTTTYKPNRKTISRQWLRHPDPRRLKRMAEDLIISDGRGSFVGPIRAFAERSKKHDEYKGMWRPMLVREGVNELRRIVKLRGGLLPSASPRCHMVSFRPFMSPRNPRHRRREAPLLHEPIPLGDSERNIIFRDRPVSVVAIGPIQFARPLVRLVVAFCSCFPCWAGRRIDCHRASGAPGSRPNFHSSPSMSPSWAPSICTSAHRDPTPTSFGLMIQFLGDRRILVFGVLFVVAVGPAGVGGVRWIGGEDIEGEASPAAVGGRAHPETFKAVPVADDALEPDSVAHEDSIAMQAIAFTRFHRRRELILLAARVVRVPGGFVGCVGVAEFNRIGIVVGHLRHHTSPFAQGNAKFDLCMTKMYGVEPIEPRCLGRSAHLSPGRPSHDDRPGSGVALHKIK